MKTPSSILWIRSRCPFPIGKVAIALLLAIGSVLAIATTVAAGRTTNDEAVNPATRPVIGLQYSGPIRVVYQISEDEWKHDVGKGLLYLKNLHKYYMEHGVDAGTLDIRAVFHGDAAAHLLTDEAWNRVHSTDTGNPNTKLISDLAERGVHVELCDTRRQREGWAKSDIHPDVLLAEAAYARLIDLQLQGYAYIRF